MISLLQRKKGLLHSLECLRLCVRRSKSGFTSASRVPNAKLPALARGEKSRALEHNQISQIKEKHASVGLRLVTFVSTNLSLLSSSQTKLQLLSDKRTWRLRGIKEDIKVEIPMPKYPPGQAKQHPKPLQESGGIQ